jgi:hypothetical protein
LGWPQGHVGEGCGVLAGAVAVAVIPAQAGIQAIPFNWLGVPPCWRAYFFLLRQEKVAKKKATPRAAPASPVPCATRNAGRLRNSGLCPSNSPRRRPPAFLRCSAPSTGTRKASMVNRLAEKTDFYGQPEKTAKNEIRYLAAPSPSLPRTRESRPLLDSRLRGNGDTGRPARIVSPGPLGGAEQRRGWRKRGEDCLRAKPEFRSPRQNRVAQGTGNAGTDPGSPSFCLLFLGEARKSETPRKGGTPCQFRTPS